MPMDDFHRAGAQAARLGDAEVQRRVGGLGQLLIGRDRQERRRTPSPLILYSWKSLSWSEDARVVERALDHRLRAWLAILLEQVPLQAAGVDADAHRTAVVAGRLDRLPSPAPSEPILPGLMRRHAAPALAASMPRL
jgi:hypothetical protein